MVNSEQKYSCQDLATCRACAKADRVVKLSWYIGLYHEFKSSPNFTSQFNTGLGAYGGSWAPTYNVTTLIKKK